MKSFALRAVPRGVVTRILPLPDRFGTEVVMLVALAAVTLASVVLKPTRLFAAVDSNRTPEIVTLVPAIPIVGEKLEIVGGESPAATVKGALTAELPDTVT